MLRPMPRYTFELMYGGPPIADDTGIEAPDRESALAYGQEVARELMRGREVQTRYWRLDIYEDRSERVAEMPFAEVDTTLDHLMPPVRTAVQRLCDSYRSWREALSATRATMRETQALLAPARGKPYLAAVNRQTDNQVIACRKSCVKSRDAGTRRRPTYLAPSGLRKQKHVWSTRRQCRFRRLGKTCS
jgi:Domain of unknown function (DUF6894)